MIKLYIKNFIRPFWRYLLAKRKQKRELVFYNDPKYFFNTLSNKFSSTTEQKLDQEPIFIFSAGWRSGSTLLQRLIASDSNTFIWGEPYDKSCLVQKLAESLLPINKNWPPEKYLISSHRFFKNTHDLNKRSDYWIANLYPDLDDLLISHQNFVMDLFSRTALENGYGRWGIKEIRFGLKEALYLKLLFPKAKFLFISRDLLPAYTSYMRKGRQDWYYGWPFKTGFSAYSFARQRAKLILEHKEAASIVDGINLTYEKLISDDSVTNLIEAYCGIKVDKDVFKKKVSSANKQNKSLTPTLLELMLLKIGNKL